MTQQPAGGHRGARRRAGARRTRTLRLRAAAALGAVALILPSAACAGEEPNSEPPDPGAPIKRSPS